MQHNESTKNEYIFNTFPYDLEPQVIFDYLTKIYNSEKSKPKSLAKILKNLATLPDHLLLYLIVEIQLMTKEKGCFAFEGRQPGCLSACFDALVYAFKLALKDSTRVYPNPELFKAVHKILTDIAKVNIPHLQQQHSGQCRSNDDEALIIPYNEVSVKGVEHLLNLMQHTFSTMNIAGDRDFKEVKSLERQALEFQHIIKLLEFIQSERPRNPKEIANMIERLQAPYDTLEFTKILSRNRLHYTFVNAVCEGFPENDNENDDVDTVDNDTDEFTLLINKLNSIGLEDWQSLIPYMVNLLEQDYGVTILNNTIKTFINKLEINQKELNEKRNSIISNNTLFASKVFYNAKDNSTLVESFLKRLRQTGQDFCIQFVDHKEALQLMGDVCREFETQFPKMLDRHENEKFIFLYSNIQLLLLIHPFVDANNRTFVNVLGLVWHALLELPGLPVYYNPFVFYAHSPDEIVESVKLNCANFLAMLEAAKNDDHIFFKSLFPKISETDKKEMRIFVKNFRGFLADFLVNDFIVELKQTIDKNLKEESSTQFFTPLNELQQTATEDINKLKTFSSLEQCIDYLKNRVTSGTASTRLSGIYKEVLDNQDKHSIQFNKKGY